MKRACFALARVLLIGCSFVASCGKDTSPREPGGSPTEGFSWRLDQSFGTGGQLLVDGGGSDYGVAIRIDHQDRVVVAGTSAQPGRNDDLVILRMSADSIYPGLQGFSESLSTKLLFRELYE